MRDQSRATTEERESRWVSMRGASSSIRPGIVVYYRTVGEATETLLVLHGGPGVSHHYLDRLAELAGDELRVVFYDQLSEAALPTGRLSKTRTCGRSLAS